MMNLRNLVAVSATMAFVAIGQTVNAQDDLVDLLKDLEGDSSKQAAAAETEKNGEVAPAEEASEPEAAAEEEAKEEPAAEAEAAEEPAAEVAEEKPAEVPAVAEKKDEADDGVLSLLNDLQSEQQTPAATVAETPAVAKETPAVVAEETPVAVAETPVVVKPAAPRSGCRTH